MKLLTDKKALLYKLRNPERITTVIKTAKTVMHKGHRLVAVPHKPEETTILRTLGFDAPDPMEYYYEFQGRFKPFEAQVKTASFLSMHRRAFCLNSMGLGKTITSLWAYDYLRHIGVVNKVLIVAPLSTLEPTWADTVFKNFMHLRAVVLYGTRQRRLKLLEEDADIYIINTDGIEIIKEAMGGRPDIDLVIVDEIAMFRNASTDRWKFLNTICNKQSDRRVWGLTGTPIPNEPTDIWAQCRVVMPDNQKVPKYFGSFRDMVMRQVSPFKWVAKDNALSVVSEVMQPAIRFALDDCVDLPEQSFLHRAATLSPEQQRAFKEMLAKLKTEIEEGAVTAVNEAVKASKLIQIACGVAYGMNHEELIIGAPNRLEVLHELVEQSEGKVLVFVPLTGALNMVAEFLRKKGYSVECVSGEVNKTERDTIFQNFQNTTDPHIIVANPGTMSHGLTLTAASSIVWYAPSYSNDIYEQACARVRRPGQKRMTVIAHISTTPMEDKIYARLAGKQKTQGILLDMIKEMEETY